MERGEPQQVNLKTIHSHCKTPTRRLKCFIPLRWYTLEVMTMMHCAWSNHNHTMQHRTDRKITYGWERRKLERATKAANFQHGFLMLAICTLIILHEAIV